MSCQRPSGAERSVPAGQRPWHDVPVASRIGGRQAQHGGLLGQAAGAPQRWVEFRRSEAGAVIAMVRAVAEARDPGEHGDGVEVIIEAPRLRGLAGLLNHDDRQAQARIVVTRPGGEVGYPFDIQLVTAYGGGAAHRLRPPS
jgi:hypothetical protein